tara:strand:- start:166 stop:1380 length:1215 start_codon:yes stop_codon:yes gene_type:complete
MAGDPMQIDIVKPALSRAFLVRQPSQGERERRGWKYYPNPDQGAAAEHFFWVNSITREEQNNDPENLTTEEIQALKSQHTFMDTDPVDGSDSDRDSDSDLDTTTNAVRIRDTRDNRKGAVCNVDCAIRSMKGMGWLQEKHKAELVKFVNENRRLHDHELNEFLRKKKYKYRVKETEITDIDIYDYAVKNMENDTCSAFIINVDSKKSKEINDKILLTMNDNYTKYKNHKMTENDYKEQYKILDNQFIKHAGHVVIICKDRNRKITLWDTQRLLDSEAYVENVGKDSINKYIKDMGLELKNFKLIEKVEGPGVSFEELSIKTSSPRTPTPTKEVKLKRKTKGKTKGKTNGKTSRKTKGKTKGKTNGKTKEKPMSKKEEKTKIHREQSKNRRKQSRADIFTRKRKN